MNAATLVLRGLRHHARTHLGVAAGAAVATATLVGALVVGDSVRFSLRRHAGLRIGAVDAALTSHDRFFTDALAARLAASVPGARAASIVEVAGSASTAAGGRRVLDVQVLGVDADFFALSPGGPAPLLPALNERLAQELGWSPGDEVVLRSEKPSGIPGDMVLATEEDNLAPLRLAPKAVATDEEFGRFSLVAGQVPPATVFVDRAELQKALELGPRANTLLASAPEEAEGIESLETALRNVWTLADAELAIRPGDGFLELVTDRIFLEEPIVAAAETLARPLLGVSTYFVNGLVHGERATPYSMVSALAPLGGTAGAEALGMYAFLPRDLRPDEVVLNSWLRDDLEASAGDALELFWFGLDATGKLVERSRELVMRGSTPIRGLAADRTLMPPFPGLHDAENCREWEPGIPVDLDRIRDKDEAYWDEYQGTPKAYLHPAAAREMWESRFGWLTSIRTPGTDADGFAREVRTALDPARVGLFLRDVRSAAQASGDSPTDFGGLFVGLSFFLIGAALLLTGLLFVFGLEARASEIGLFLALGYAPARVRRIFLGEAAVLAAVGAVVGSALGLGYTRAVLRGLDTLWRGAVGRATLLFHVEPRTVAVGAVAAFLVSTLAMLLTLRHISKNSATVLLSSRPGSAPAVPAVGGARPSFLRRGLPVGLCLAGALVAVLLVDPGAGMAAAGAFFGAGTLVLVACLLLVRFGLRGATDALSDPGSLGRLGIKNARRRAGRSLAVVGLMAIGAFLVCGIGVYRQGPTPTDAGRRSGTGGFAFFARASVPVLPDLRTERGREAFGAQEGELLGVDFVPLRVRVGDEASCLNLARPQEPRLLAVDPEELRSRGAFSFAKAIEDVDDPWTLLARDLGADVVPAIGDLTSLTWTLKRKLGDELDYTDERGRAFRVRIVAALADSILQGDLIVAEERFVERFPSEAGYRAFLIDAPFERREAVGAELSRALADVGLAVEPTGRRLDAFHAVQNTYLAIFQLLGGLGVLLGSAGLGMVVLRNAMERRGELALARALGFAPRAVGWWLISEHGFLLLLGLATGSVAAAVAIVPALRGAAPELSLSGLASLLLLVLANGVVWILVATFAAVRSAPFRALHQE